MSDENTQWYLDFIAQEIEKLKEGRFTGHIEFQINWKEGAVANMNVTLRKSVRKIIRNK